MRARLTYAGGLLALALVVLSGCGGGEGSGEGGNGAPGVAADRQPTRPNIVLIVADDHRADALGAAGHPRLRTPNLDRIADEGVRFRDAFVTTSLCSPSRASILTGAWAHGHGVVANETADPPAGMPTLGTALQDAGYRTAWVGKWHMLRKATPRPGFDDWISFTGQGDYFRNTYWDNGTWRLSHEYVTDELSRRAAEWIRAAGPEPFLLVLSHKAAHEPFFPAPRHRDAFAGAVPAPPPATASELAAQPDWGGRRPRADATARILAYERTLLAVDEGVGLVLDALAERGILDETVVVYTGDNGYLLGEHGGLWDKRAAYEPSIRVPMLVRYPPLAPAGTVSDALALNVDIAPTLLDLAGVAVPPSMQGASWRGALQGGPWRDGFLYEYFREIGEVPAILAVRTKDWKLVTYPENPELGGELYDLRADPAERRNLWRDGDHAQRREELLLRLEAELAATGFPGRD